MKSNPTWQSARIHALRDLTPTVREFVIAPAGGVAERWAPGARQFDDFGLNDAIEAGLVKTPRVVVRGAASTGFRAPTLAPVGAGTTLSSGALPCSDGSEFFDTFCGGFEGDDGYLSEIYGNPGLEAETSTAWYLGSVFSLGDRPEDLRQYRLRFPHHAYEAAQAEAAQRRLGRFG